MKSLCLFTVAMLILTAVVPHVALCEPEGIGAIKKALSEVESILTYVINRTLGIVKSIMRALYLLLFAIGIVLWASGINSGRGKQLILGAAVLAVVAELL